MVPENVVSGRLTDSSQSSVAIPNPARGDHGGIVLAFKATTNLHSSKENSDRFWGLSNRDVNAKLCDPLVTMVQSPDFRKGSDSADGLYGTRFR